MEKRKNDFGAFRKIDAAQPKNLIASPERSRFIENRLLYHSSERFTEKFLETKRKSALRNPYKPEENSTRSAILRIAYTNFFMEHAYYL
jgi:hypothetical protein